MRTFDYRELPAELMAPDVMNLVAAIHECRGRQQQFANAQPPALEALREVAAIHSAGASNRIEGIFTSEGRLKAIVAKGAEPRTRAEEEIAGYRDVLATIHESHAFINVTPSVILQLHRDLFRYCPQAFAGRWKDSDNAIVELDERGQRHVRFQPPPAVAVSGAMEQLCNAHATATRQGLYDPLLLLGMFTFDFVCIHPFNDGNGRMSRLLMLLLLYQAGYTVGAYVSIEKEIEASKETYYETLQACSAGWMEGRNVYAPFVRYVLGVVLAAYRELEEREAQLCAGHATKAQRVEQVFNRRVGKVTKADILAECPDISETTVERALASLLAQGRIEKVGAGRTTGYCKKG